MNEVVEIGDVVTVECTGRLLNGMSFMSPSSDGPIEFQVGNYEVIKGLNIAVKGMGLDQSKTLTLDPEDCFGVIQESLIVNYPLSDLPENTSIGMQLKGPSAAGGENDQVWRVKDIQKENNIVTLDANHPLAGQKINFDIKLIKLIKN
jgi:peptidylprolyl isomerase